MGICPVTRLLTSHDLIILTIYVLVCSEAGEMINDSIIRHFEDTQPLFARIVPLALERAAAANHSLLDEFHFLPCICEVLRTTVVDEEWLSDILANYDEELAKLVCPDKDFVSVVGTSPTVYSFLYSAVSVSMMFREVEVHPNRALLHLLSFPGSISYEIIRRVSGEPRERIDRVASLGRGLNTSLESSYYLQLHDNLLLLR
jgi:hypothetical protein